MLAQERVHQRGDDLEAHPAQQPAEERCLVFAVAVIALEDRGHVVKLVRVIIDGHGDVADVALHVTEHLHERRSSISPPQ
jgi:hypothetical protein